jgi:hypothetical protein
MAPTQGICNSFKQELLKAIHDFTTSTGDTFKLALVTSASTISASTANLAAISSEVASGAGYTTGGIALTIPSSMPSLTSTTAWTTFSNVTWSSSSITARGGLLYNSTPTSGTNPAVMVLDFGSDKVSVSGDFTVVFPTADSSAAIIRIT